MKLLPLMRLAGLAILGLFLSASVHADDYGKRSLTEERAIASADPGVNVRGESSGFDDYLNDDLYGGDDEIRLLDVDSDSRVVLGSQDAPVGMSFKKSYESSPIAE